MFLKRLVLTGLVAGIGLGTTACTDGYGYSGLSVGYGAPAYGYGDGWYGDQYDSGYGYGSSYFGWYGDFYYPGSGVYVYDRYRRPFRWNGDQQRYWQGRRGGYRGNRGGAGNWNGFAPNGGGQQGYRGQQPYSGAQRHRGQPFTGGDQFRGGPNGPQGNGGYRYHGRNGPNAGTASPAGERQVRNGDAGSFVTRVAPAIRNGSAAGSQGNWRGGGGRRGRR
jgi:hypothetical protein